MKRKTMERAEQQFSLTKPLHGECFSGPMTASVLKVKQRYSDRAYVATLLSIRRHASKKQEKHEKHERQTGHSQDSNHCLDPSCPDFVQAKTTFVDSKVSFRS